jgi:hypothetical protein
MNSVTRATITIPRRAPARATMQVRALPFIMEWPMNWLILIPILGVVIISMTMIARLTKPESDPFSNYREVFPGQPRSVVIAQGFSCDSSNKTGSIEWCTSGPSDSPFYLVSVSLKDGIVTRIDFATRENALVVGELPVSWGRPEIQLYGESAILKWPDVGVSANGWTESGQFSYFMPVVRLSLAAQATT